MKAQPVAEIIKPTKPVKIIPQKLNLYGILFGRIELSANTLMDLLQSANEIATSTKENSFHSKGWTAHGILSTTSNNPGMV